MPRDFLFGMIRVPMWDYYWGLTAAQVELLTIDQPIVVYKADKDNDKPWKNGTATEGYAKSQYQKWLEKKKKREAEGKDLGKMFQNGRRIDFDKLLNTGEEKPLK
jgi:hypothetical protein